MSLQTPAATTSLSRIRRSRDVLLGVGVLMIVAMMIIPIPPLLLDMLLALNIAFAVIILLVTLFAEEPLDFSVFPSILLIVTLYRLALNVSSTRLILLDGEAGAIIESFGSFVVGGNIIVGLIIFVVLLVIQFLVITNGAGRVAEVAARFTLDAMPGKQMAIDADLSAGVITEAQARERREKIGREADFYGAMDGASKFVRGDAIAALIIVVINLFAGVAIGVLQRGLSVGDATSVFALLTVGDGLVSQVPALLISTATGIVITRNSGGGEMAGQITTQLFGNPKVLMVAGGMLVVMGVTPGLPLVPFVLIGGSVAGIGYFTQRRRRQRELEMAAARAEPTATPPSGPEEVVSLIQPDPMEIEIGYGLIPLVEESNPENLLQRVTIIRRQMAMELGLVLPTVRIRDNLQLPPNTYVIKLRGIEVGRGELVIDQLMAMNPGTAEEAIEGTAATEPAFGLPAQWIEASSKERAEMMGYTVVDPASVVATHLTEVIRRHAPSILSRQDVQMLLNNLKQDYPAAVEDVVPNLLTIGEIQQVLQNLLAERIPIRDLMTILETLANHAGATRDPELLTEYARSALSRSITSQLQDQDSKLHVITLSPAVETLLAESLQSETNQIVLEPVAAQEILTNLGQQMEGLAQFGRQPLLLCASRLRRPLRRLTERALPNLSILSYNEVAPDADVQADGVVEVTQS